MESQTKRLQEFQDLLEPHAPARTTNSATSFVQDIFGHQPQGDREDFSNPDKPRTTQSLRTTLNPVLGVINQTPASLDSRVYHDPTAEALGLPSLMSSTPPAAPQAPQLTGTLPRRKF